MPKVKVLKSPSNKEFANDYRDPEDTTSHFTRAMRNTRFGDTIAYYDQGDKAQKPLVAIVTDVTPTGLCLHVLPPSRPARNPDYIRHIDDPWHAENPQRKQSLRDKGAWDTLGAAYTRMDDEVAKAKAELIRRQKADEANAQAQIDEIPLMEDIALAAEQMAIQGISLPDMVAQLHGQATIGQLRQHFEDNPVSA